MAVLAADFKADLLMMARQYLEERWRLENVPDRDVLPRYFDSLPPGRFLASCGLTFSKSFSISTARVSAAEVFQSSRHRS